MLTQTGLVFCETRMKGWEALIKQRAESRASSNLIADVASRKLRVFMAGLEWLAEAILLIKEIETQRITDGRKVLWLPFMCSYSDGLGHGSALLAWTLRLLREEDSNHILMFSLPSTHTEPLFHEERKRRRRLQLFFENEYRLGILP